MMKRCFTVALAASLLVALGSVAQAAQGMPSQATLRAMGLSGMQVISDFDAMSIRGMGYQKSHSKAIAFGISYAKVSGHGAEAGSIDGYYAEGKHFAAGKHGSIAGKIVITKGGKRKHRGHDGGNMDWVGDTNTTPPNGDHHGGGHKNVKVKAVIVFAGGFAVSKAY
jgi:hypothetical protein